eukprot:1036607-Amphidinium_carterae.1
MHNQGAKMRLRLRTVPLSLEHVSILVSRGGLHKVLPELQIRIRFESSKAWNEATHRFLNMCVWDFDEQEDLTWD